MEFLIGGGTVPIVVDPPQPNINSLLPAPVVVPNIGASSLIVDPNRSGHTQQAFPTSAAVANQQENALQGLLADLDAFDTGGGGSTSSTSSSSTTTNSSSSTSTTIQRVLNEAAREAAFNSQRDATSGAFDNQITSIGETLTGLLELLSNLQSEQIAGVDEQEQLATDNTNRQVGEGSGVIDTELANLLTSLADGEARIRAEQELVTSSIAATRDQDLRRITSQDAALRLLGGGSELSGATQQASARANEISQIDSGLANRLASAAAQDFDRRRIAADTTAAAARTDLNNNAALILAQIGAAAAQQRNTINVNSAQAELGLQQQFDQQILEAQLQRDLAAAQRFIPEPVRESTTTSSSTSTSTTSGGSTTTNSGGGGGLSPSEQFAFEQTLAAAEALVAPPPTTNDFIQQQRAQLQLEALQQGDITTANLLR